ncbi:transposase domain-containing protein [Psychrobacter sp. HD31]|uniref:transposase domain-containing protein n=1 Tax=Psychrobacter sp. HD31 TaxID=3112003 RepID=UPI003DA2386A
MEVKNWLNAQELADLNLTILPNTKAGVINRAKKSNWKNRKRSGRGGGVEYAFEGLPQDVQNEIHIKTAKKAARKQAKAVDKNQPNSNQPKQANYLPEVIWSGWESATDKQKKKAEDSVACCFAVDDLINAGMGTVQAIEKVSTDNGVSKGSLRRWFYKVRNFERSDWMPILLGNYKKSSNRQAEFSEEAWQAFKADYLRPERPQMGTCYERLKLLANEHGWTVPSLSSIKRKLEREVPKTQQIMLRDGERALAEMYPAMMRSVDGLEALEWINGDGYQHNVFVRWHNGEIVRPKTWLWQDVRTRKILAYRTDLSENSDVIRLALMDVVSKFGIPRKVTIDNTRAAANKWMTGGVKNRYRFKVKEDDPMGIIPLLGMTLFWTSVQFGKGHGQAKPIERAFSHGGLGETVDKHPLLAGHHAGANVMDKPDNYHGGKDGVAYEDFITALEQGIELWNNREKRNTEICQGTYSFSQIFERDYANATIRKATPEQMRLLMLMSEAVTLKNNGTFTLSCGGKVHGQKNRYEAVDLIGSGHKKVVVKFDPKQLHNTVWVYSLDGRFLAEAICTEKVAFGDKAKGREHDKARKQYVKAEKAMAKAQQSMGVKELANLIPESEEELLNVPNLIEMVIAEGNTLRKKTVAVEAETDVASDFDDDFMKAMEMMKKGGE